LSTYLEFKALEYIAILHGGENAQNTGTSGRLDKVPSSREDVFTSDLTLQQKRKLMKFLNYALNVDLGPPAPLPNWVGVLITLTRRRLDPGIRKS